MPSRRPSASSWPGHYAAFARNRERLVAARAEIATCAISGAVGTFANIDPYVEKHVAEKLGLAVEPVSTQVIPRDRHAMFFATLGVIASSIENLAVEIRHLQRTEVREAEEYFSPGQKGSSAMPHKRNPVLSENLTGLARLVRAARSFRRWKTWRCGTSGISPTPPSSGSWRRTPPSLWTSRWRALIGMMEKLVVYPDRMRKNLDELGGLVFSQRVLLALTQAGMSREGAYVAVQRNAMAVWREGGSFLQNLQNDPDVTQHLDADALAALFNMAYHTKHVDTVFKRVFGE